MKEDLDQGGGTDARELFERVTRGQFDQQVCAWLSRGFEAFARSVGGFTALPLERCLRLPRGASTWRLDERNVAIRAVGRQLEADGSAGCSDLQRAIAVHAAIERFATRGAWLLWRDYTAPPADASALQAALFQALRTSGGRVLGLKQVQRVLTRRR